MSYAPVTDRAFAVSAEPIPLKQRRRSTEPRESNAAGWQEGYALDDRGRPHPNTSNALVAIRNSPDLRDAFAFDVRAQTAMLLRPLPGMEKGKFEPRPLTDTDTAITQVFVQTQCSLPRMGKESVNDAIDIDAHDHSYDPFRDELDALAWDGVPRIASWLSFYAGADAESAYVQAVGLMMLIALVARTYVPGCKFDNIVIFVADQGVGKSSALRIIGGRYFSDSLPDTLTGKDASQHLLGKSLIELAELNSMNKSTATEIKAFATRQSEKYRPPYGRREVIQPRRCILVGTTNADVFLRDETGGRRFWPVKLGTIDLDALARDRDQLLAEAVHLYRQGVPWWPSREQERELFAPEQEARFEADAWEDDVREFLIGKTSVLVKEIAREALGFVSISRVGTADRNRITAILRRLGWAVSKKDWKGNRPFRPISEVQSDLVE